MAHLQYIPGDPRLVDQLVYELKSKGIFDQFRKDCIADVDTRPAYQNLRQRVENSVSTFLARQCWQPDLNKNQLREKLRKHILDGNYLEQGVERIVDQVVNPKVASVFIPQVEDLVYNYLGITRKKTVPVPETSNGKVCENDLLPTDLEAVSPGSVNDDRNDEMEDLEPPGVDSKMEVDQEDTYKLEIKDGSTNDATNKVKNDAQESQMSVVSEPISIDSNSSIDKSCIPLPDEEIKLENIPAPENSPPKSTKIKVELEKIQLPEEPNVSTDIPLPEETFKSDKDHYFKPVNSDDDDSSSDSSLRRNMSPLTPIRNFNNENSCDAQQAFENDSIDNKIEKTEPLEPNSFRFTIESKEENSSEVTKAEKKDTDQANLSYQFKNQVNINAFNTPMYDDSSNSNLLHIDYESDANSKLNIDNKTSEADQNSNETKKGRRQEDKKSSHRSSHHKDSHRHSSSKDKKSDSKQTSSRDSKSDKKSSKDDHKGSNKSSHKERSSDRSDKKDSRESSKHRSSHKSSSSHKDSKSHRSSSSSQRHSSSKHSDEKKSSSSSHRDKEKSSKDDKHSKEKSSKDPKSSSSSHKSEKDRKSTSSSKSKHDDKEKKKDKKETDDHYSASGRGSHSRRSTDRDSNDGSSSSKGSHNPSSRKSCDSKKESKSSTSKSDTTSTSGDSTSPSDKDHLNNETKQSKSGNIPLNKPIIRVDNHLEVPIHSPPRLAFVPDVTLKKPKIAANLEEARKLMKMRKFLDEEQKRMNQEAALLLEFQANVRPSMSQVYSSISGPELEFACVATTSSKMVIGEPQTFSENKIIKSDNIETRNESISDILNAAEQVENIDEIKDIESQEEKVIVVVEQIEPAIIERETDEENSETDKATVRVEKSMDTDEKVVHHIPVNNKNDKILYILTEANEEENESKILDKETLESEKLTNIVDTDAIVEMQTRNDESATENINMIETDEIEMKLSLLHEKKYPDYAVQVIVIAEEVSDTEDIVLETANKVEDIAETCTEEIPLQYFGEHEKYKAELERDTFSKFLKTFTEKCTEKIYLINCNTYEEKILKEVLQNLGIYEVVNYHKNGHLNQNKTGKNIVRNVNVSSEISLPVDSVSKASPSRLVFSPVKSECSFELSSDYDAKLEEMVSKTSRREIMEIILGNAAEESADDTEMPTIDYCSEFNIVSDTENTVKRKYCEVESSENNNRQVLTPNKIRKLSDSDQITSTTGESVEASNNNVSMNNTSVRSKYLGRARRVGLPRPRRSNVANSPSSDKSIENYEQNTPVTQTPNGKIKTPRNKIQRYDTSELYKPKLHYLSRRNNVS
ncbi:unnamed protein product [Chilo suppressalis]|uniref:BOD1/SHG1 domain-containing protein n=1 Tax=Chilo suppressalis TaxID=168631 RepID=A0ABN8AZ79_CHISP|nr:unnamed protein product [Chilo suppressalis]